MSTERFPALVLFLLGSFAAGAIGSFATFSSVAEWYPTLTLPGWTPPRWVFGPVWAFLYATMALAAWRAWRRSSTKRPVLVGYATQLVLNAAWSVFFFGLRRPDLALVDVILFWFVLVVMLVQFARVDRLATILWVPYVAWVSYATALNAAVVVLN